MRSRSLLITCVLLAAPARMSADTGPNAVTDWAAIVQHAIHNASAPRPPASSQVLHAQVLLAVYDAVVAIEGGYEPYATAIPAYPGADVRAAVATAAYLTARARVAMSQHAYLDTQYASYLSAIPDGQSKTDGVQVGAAAATAMLALRANDGLTTWCSISAPPTHRRRASSSPMGAVPRSRSTRRSVRLCRSRSATRTSSGLMARTR